MGRQQESAKGRNKAGEGGEILGVQFKTTGWMPRRWPLRKDLGEMREDPGRGNSQGKGPEVGSCQLCFKDRAQPAWWEPGV